MFEPSTVTFPEIDPNLYLSITPRIIMLETFSH